MSTDISYLPDAVNRQPSDWVDYFKIMYSAVVQGESVSANGRSVTLPPLSEIKKELVYWQNKALSAETSSSGLTKAQQSAPVVLF